MLELDASQLSAVERMHNGCILFAEPGSGKSRTSLAYYIFKECKGSVPVNGSGSLGAMKAPRDLYIITTAKKRDSFDWIEECGQFCVTSNPRVNISNVSLTVDSWNNIKKYQRVVGAFFIFDEQRVSGTGAWVKTFLKIAKQNHWILLTATPGDKWSDYIPVFVANGFYRNKTEFYNEHAVYSRYTKYPKIEKYVNTGILLKHKNELLVPLKCVRETERHRKLVTVGYDKKLYFQVWRNRWDPYDDCPIKETGKLFYLMRKVVNSDLSRAAAVKEILAEHPCAIIFYNFTYELEILRCLLKENHIKYSEWNGLHHDPIPEGEQWVYLVQYIAGCEGWNCTSTDTIIFYSLNYSYRMTVQAEGRIDRRNTEYKDLYYYSLKSVSPIDIAIMRTLKDKKDFNEQEFLNKTNSQYNHGL